MSQRLRQATKAIHLEAERSGFFAEMLTGRSSLEKYCLLLRNFHELYAQLERCTAAHKALMPLFADPALARTQAIEHDLRNLQKLERQEVEPLKVELHGFELPKVESLFAMPVLPALQAYVDRIHFISDTNPLLLNAHAYVRYFGDLSGGQILMKTLTAKYGFQNHQLRFYQFPNIVSTTLYKNRIRQDLDANPDLADNYSGLEQETLLAFQHNINVSMEVAASRQLDPRFT